MDNKQNIKGLLNAHIQFNFSGKTNLVIIFFTTLIIHSISSIIRVSTYFD